MPKNFKSKFLIKELLDYFQIIKLVIQMNLLFDNRLNSCFKIIYIKIDWVLSVIGMKMAINLSKVCSLKKISKRLYDKNLESKILPNPSFNYFELLYTC